MIRRFLCLAAILLILLSIPACGSDDKGKAKDKGPVVPDPDGGAKPGNLKTG
jgi:hypothetical protein